ncbi:MAG: hypothetical protein HY602_03000 [Parcubacteria group bacterium]|nr:hypothetical protein [Parcubacteria group bacterium]
MIFIVLGFAVSILGVAIMNFEDYYGMPKCPELVSEGLLLITILLYFFGAVTVIKGCMLQ